MSLKNRAKNLLRPAWRHLREVYRSGLLTPWQKWVGTPARIAANAEKKSRRLEIGPGATRTPGFETANVTGGHDVDYVVDASLRLPFPDATFDIVYASHILEHIAWFRTKLTLTEWVRVLKPGGRLEIWVPDGELICQHILDQSHGKQNDAHLDGWNKQNPDGDPFLWANGRLFYGLNDSYPSWHKAIFTEASLGALFREIGLSDVHRPADSEYRGGANHGPINLGMFGTKP